MENIVQTKEIIENNENKENIENKENMFTPVNLIDSKTKIKISTVFNNNTTNFGKQNMFDNCDDTSWYSDQGKFQYVFLFFDTPCEISRVELTASGGFCPKVPS
jgi:hypothetical protein